jgi:hypothetical protein
MCVTHYREIGKQRWLEVTIGYSITPRVDLLYTEWVGVMGVYTSGDVQRLCTAGDVRSDSIVFSCKDAFTFSPPHYGSTGLSLDLSVPGQGAQINLLRKAPKGELDAGSRIADLYLRSHVLQKGFSQ